MRRIRRSALLIGAATLVGSLVVAQTSAAQVDGATGSRGAASGTATSYLVLATSAATVDETIAAVQAIGGRVDRVNRAIGLVSVSSADTAFATKVSARAGVDGVARSTPIGSVPAAARHPRRAVEQEGRDAAGVARAAVAAASSKSGDDPDAEPLSSMQWDMRMIGATPDGSYDEQPGRKGVLVGIIDTGIDGTHPDIAPNFDAALSRNFTQDIELIDGPCADEPDQSCDDAADVDEDGHGTHVAGTVASPINGIGMAGVAPNVTLVNLRAGQDSGYFFLAPTVDALTYAGDNGIDVVNMSFFVDPWLYNCRNNPGDSDAEKAEQTTILKAVQRALDYARARGVTLVAALGNEHQDLGAAIKTDATSPDFPPGTERVRDVTNDCLDMPTEGRGVIAVSSVGPSGKKSDFSNHGLEQNDVSAPGGFYRDFIGTPQNRVPENLILGPYPTNVALANGDVDTVTGESLTPFVIAQCSAPGVDHCAYYQLIQGTSMATPHAVGVASLIVSEDGRRDRKHGGLTLAPATVDRILRRSATDVACPSAVITYAAEGRAPDYDAPCVGSAKRNSIYGDGIVNALRAVS